MNGTTLSAFAVARLALNVPAGAFADARGRRPLIVAGPVITGMGMLGSAFAGSLPELFAWRFVSGAGSAVYAAGAQARFRPVPIRRRSRGERHFLRTGLSFPVRRRSSIARPFQCTVL